MIHTLTLNTAIDMNIFCDPLQPAAVNRTRQTEYCPNGKGVNVSLVLHHYQQPTHVMGIFGGFTGRYIVEELRKQHINVTPAWVAEPTRINIFINDGSDEYKLVNPGARIDDEGKEQILHHLQCVAPGDYLVISGSLPPGIESRFYSEICGEVIVYAWMDRRRENSEKPYGTRLGAGQAVSARLVGK